MPDRGTTLVVNDDQLTCELVQVVLAAEGFHVLIATTGSDETTGPEPPSADASETKA